MFSALLKAFTGRAGLLAGLLALALVIVTAAAVYMKMPAIEQNLADSALPVLQSQLGDADDLTSVRAEGRNLLLEGRFANPMELAAQLKGVEGVRSVIINGADLSAGMQQTPAPLPEEADQEAAQSEPVETELPSEETTEVEVAGEPVPETQVPEAEVTEEVAAVDAPEATAESLVEQTQTTSTEGAEETAVADIEEETVAQGPSSASVDESSLSLRYDGTRLQLSGHMGDEQMAQLVVDSVRRAIPRNSELETNVDATGKSSPLNWMRDFLKVVSRLPDDAQGVIEGSDSQGVRIIPDVEQTMLKQERLEPSTEDAAKSPADEIQTEDPVVEDTVEPELESPVATEMVAAEEVEMAGQMPVVEAPQAPTDEPQSAAGEEENIEAEVDTAIDPGQYIVALNKRILVTPMFKTGEYEVSEELAQELNGLAQMLIEHPQLALRIVGNIDFDADPRVAEFVGMDRARAVRNYLYQQGVERNRLFARPLPRDYAFKKQVQLVFYISE